MMASQGAVRQAIARKLPILMRLPWAALKEPDIERVAAQWVKFDGFAGCSREGAAVVLRELASFAGCASDRGSSVLQVTDEL